MIRKEFLFKSVSNTDKTVLITAGLHGDQQTSIYAVDELIHSLQTKSYKPIGVKKIIIYNYINSIGILQRDRYCKNLDLNREFSQICSSNKDIQQIKRQLNNIDIAIDVHASYNSTQFFFIDDDKFGKSYIEFLSQINLNYVVSPINNQNTLKYYINKLSENKSGFTLELNQNGNNIDIASALRGVSMLKKLIDNCIKLKKYKSVFPQNLKSVLITADISGLLKINDVLGKNVNRGQKIGYILSLDKSRMINIIAPCNGKVIVYPSFMTYIAVNSPIITIQPTF